MQKEGYMLKIFEPIKIGKVELKNRMSQAPALMSYCSPEGYVTSRMIRHYQSIAEGGVGLVTVGVHFLNSQARVWAGQEKMGTQSNRTMIPDDTYIPGLKKLAKAIHKGGAKASLQICHTAKYSEAEINLVPSAINPFMMNPTQKMKEMTQEDIDREIENFVQAAIRIKKAGFDAVTIHGAHGFMPQQFMSPYSNQRTDKYGKDRMLFSVELVQRMRAAVGPDFAIIFRMSGEERLEEVGQKGYTVDEVKNIAPRLEEAGVDCLDVSIGVPETAWITFLPHYYPRGYLLYLAEAVKKLVKIPVIGVGRINNPETAIKAVEEGKCDIVSMARQLFADPEFPKKLKEKRYEDINQCIACMHCIEHAGYGVECAVNPSCGREEEYEIVVLPPRARKKVLVVGGGPGGMEAARVAKLRGHDVTLYEKTDKLGGQLNIACVPPGKEEMRNPINYLSTQIKKLGVKVVMEKEVTADVVKKEKPDVVIVATGCSQFLPEIKGIDGDNVVMAWDVLAGKAEVGETVAIIGGELLGCEVADYLSDKGKKVTITNLWPGVAESMNPFIKPHIMRHLTEKSVEMLSEVTYLEINKEGMRLLDKDKKERTINADSIVVAAGSKPNRDLIPEIKGLTTERVWEVGDCAQPRLLWNAIQEGSKVARSI